MTSINSRLLLQWVLWLIAIHSICFGLALISFPSGWINFFGFQLQEKFFADQGGVFHLIISLAYIMAALSPENSLKLIILSCVTKFTAALFLFSYFLFDKPIFMVLVSGIGDLLMGLAILFSYRLYIRSR
ncbi:MAG: hypothetical protein NTU51_01610 [Bacteroidetes bacterium]|nr:hypothetical protein [Bacteroidota bacterium]